MARTALNTVPSSRSAAREKLAEEIAGRKHAEKRVRENAVHVERLQAAVLEQVVVVDAAQQAVGDIQTAAVLHLANPVAPAPAKTVKQALADVEEAEARLTDLRAARGVAEGEMAKLRSSAEMRGMFVKDAIAAAMREEPATRRLVERYAKAAQEAETLKLALELLAVRRALPQDLTRWWANEAPTNSGVESWERVFSALAEDADADVAAIVE